MTKEFLAEHQIATVVHGDDLSPLDAERVYGAAAAAGKLRYVRRTLGISTTELIQRVLNPVDADGGPRQSGRTP